MRGVAHGDPVMAPFWAVRPGANREPELAMPRRDDGEGEGPGRETTFRAAPPAPLPALAAEADGQNIETMHKLIQQLAVQLNAPADPPAKPSIAATYAAGAALLPQTGPSAPRHDDVASLSRREALDRWTRRATNMTAAMIG